MELLKYIQNHYLIADGAFSTYFNSYYYQPARAHERTNYAEESVLTKPDRTVAIHKNYIKQGARLLRTNTFAANSTYMQDYFSWNKKDKDCRLYYKAAFQLLCQAEQQAREEQLIGTEESIFKAVDFGPIHDSTDRSREQILEEYKTYCDIMLEMGADIFLFETQSEWTYIKDLIPYLKEKSKKETPITILANFAINSNGYTSSGLHINSLLDQAKEYKKIGLDVFGFNCGVSSSHLYHFLEDVDLSELPPLCVMPNSGYPQIMQGRVLYPVNIQYFTENMLKLAKLGIPILGGCCGTTPEFIYDLSRNVSSLKYCKPEKKETNSHALSFPSSYIYPSNAQDNSKDTQKPEERMGAFRRKLKDTSSKTFVVELDPPFNTDFNKVYEGAKKLASTKVDLLTLSDSPLGRPRADASHLAAKIQKELALPVLPHISCRDKNVIAMRSSLLGMHIQGIRHALIVTGDPVPDADKGHISSVYDFNSIRLMEYIKQLNTEINDPEGKSSLIYGGALNYHGVNHEAIAHRMKIKMDAGCSFFLTQPVYSKEDIQRLAWLKEKTGAVIFGGIMPLISYKNAQFIKNEMPGIHVPQNIVNAYKENLSREEYEKIALDISVKIGNAMADSVDGYYFMTPFNRVDLIINIMNAL